MPSLMRRIADEVDPYKKPPELLEVSPKGLVPALRFHDSDIRKSLHESTVILEYLEEYVTRTSIELERVQCSS